MGFLNADMKKIVVLCISIVVFSFAKAQKPKIDTLPPLNAALRLSLAFNGYFVNAHGYNFSNVIPSFIYWRNPRAINQFSIEALSFNKDTIPVDTVASQQGKSNIHYQTNIGFSWEQDYHYLLRGHPNVAFYMGNAFYLSYYRDKYAFNPSTGYSWSDSYIKFTFGLTFGVKYFFNDKYYIDFNFPIKDIAGVKVDETSDGTPGLAHNGNNEVIHDIFFNMDSYTVRFGVGVRLLNRGRKP